METRRWVEADPKQKKDDLIVITGAGGFIAGNLVLYFTNQGFTNIRRLTKNRFTSGISLFQECKISPST